MDELKNFLDNEGRLTAFPAKRKRKLYALWYLVGKFQPGVRYTELEVNEILCWNTTFHDPATLRRELHNNHFLGREADGKAYWLEERQPTLAELGIAE